MMARDQVSTPPKASGEKIRRKMKTKKIMDSVLRTSLSPAAEY
jgi:hypothetical protein